MSALKPCPFCGDASYLHQDLDNYWSVFCRNEECKGSVGSFPARDEALLAWGNRQPLHNNVKPA